MELAQMKQVDEAGADPHHVREGYACSVRRRHPGNCHPGAGRRARCCSFIIPQHLAATRWPEHSNVHRTGNTESHARIHCDSYCHGDPGDRNADRNPDRSPSNSRRKPKSDRFPGLWRGAAGGGHARLEPEAGFAPHCLGRSEGDAGNLRPDPTIAYRVCAQLCVGLAPECPPRRAPRTALLARDAGVLMELVGPCVYAPRDLPIHRNGNYEWRQTSSIRHVYGARLAHELLPGQALHRRLARDSRDYDRRQNCHPYFQAGSRDIPLLRLTYLYGTVHPPVRGRVRHVPCCKRRCGLWGARVVLYRLRGGRVRRRRSA
jgi:hypothetical protein